jgi:hypothetical protein
MLKNRAAEGGEKLVRREMKSRAMACLTIQEKRKKKKSSSQ